MRVFISCLMMLIVLSSCATFRNKKDRITFHGVEYRAKAEKLDKDTRNIFNVQIKPVSASLDGAREAGRYEGTKYCIQHYGTSQIKWVVGPESDAKNYQIDKDILTLQGRCMP